MNGSITRLALGILVSLAAASAARATTKTWNGGDGLFAQPGRWSTSSVPGTADHAFVGGGGGSTVTFSNNSFPLPNPVLNQDLNITGGNVTFTSGSGGPYTYRLTGSGGDDVNINSGTLTLGAMGNPLHMTIDDDLVIRSGTNLNVKFGSVVNTLDLLLAESAGGSGAISVEGTGSQLNVSSVAIQSLGLGGGTATLSFFSGSGGTFSGPLDVGVSSDAGTAGVLNVQAGAQVNIANLSVGSGTAAGTTGTVNINGSGSALVQSGAATLTVGAASGGSGFINIGTTTTGGTLTTGSGLFTINHGTVYVGSATAAGTLNANGDVTIDRGVLQVLNTGSTFLLAAGKTFTVQNGGFVSFLNGKHHTPANAIYNITGTNSNWNGILLINGGAQVNVNDGGLLSGEARVGADGTVGTLNIGATASGGTLTGSVNIFETGTVNIGSATTTGTFNVGFSVTIAGGVLRVFNSGSNFRMPGSGMFIVENGGQATFDLDGGTYRTTAYARYIINGTNSKWEFVDGSGLFVDDYTEVNVTSGGLLSVAGDVSLRQCELTIDSGGTLTANALLGPASSLNFINGTVGITGPAGLSLDLTTLGGNFSLTSNRTLNVTNTTTIPVGSSLALEGGTLDTGSLVNDGAFNFNSGTLSAGSIVNNGALTVNNTAIDAPVVNNNAVTVVGTVDFNGPVSGPGDFFGPGTARFNGGLAVGASAAEVSFEGGNVVFGNANMLVIELGGTTPGSQFDHVDVAGQLSLGGTLAVSLIGSASGLFEPEAGDSFDILDWGSVSGTFNLLSLPALSPNLSWDTTDLYAAGVLRVNGTLLAGDFQEDFDVDGDDLALWRGGFGAATGATHMQGDADDDHDVDGGDFLVWQRQLTGSPSVVASAPVPEPASLGMLLTGTLAMFFRRRAG